MHLYIARSLAVLHTDYRTTSYGPFISSCFSKCIYPTLGRENLLIKSMYRSQSPSIHKSVYGFHLSRCKVWECYHNTFKKTLAISDAHYVNCSSEFYPHIGNTNEGTSNFCHNVMIAIQNKLFHKFTKVLNIVYLYKTGHMLIIFMPLDEEIKSR